ncbi:MAG: CsbD family protein [wastewater metagenome]|nr:CsbD family protein [Candidatus Loosdrechtia aerotolerans]
MNKDILKGKWNQLKGEVKKRWGSLTDDDITKIEGQSDKLIGILQEKYGYSREKAEEEVDQFLGTSAR